MNETIGEHIYEYEDISFKLFIPDYWSKIYKGQPRKKLYHDYCVMLDLVKKVDKNRWIVDIGVNHGIFAVPASMLGYKVLGFEPIKGNYDNVQDARVINNLKDFHVYNFAVSNSWGLINMYVPECIDNASFSEEAAISNMRNKERSREVVSMVKFDEWINNNPKFSDIGFIKVDVQGAEYLVLEGMREFLNNAYDIYIVAEYENHLNKLGHTFEELDELFKSYGFVEQPKILPNDKLWYKA